MSSKRLGGLVMFALGVSPCLGRSKGQFYRKAFSVESAPEERPFPCYTLCEFHDTHSLAEKSTPKNYSVLPVRNIATGSLSRHNLKVEETMSSIPFRALDPSLVPQWLLQNPHQYAVSRVSRSTLEQAVDTLGGSALAPATSNLRGSSPLQTDTEVHTTTRSESALHPSDTQQKGSRNPVSSQPKERQPSKYSAETYTNPASLNDVLGPWVQDSHSPRYVAHGTPSALDHSKSRDFVQQSKSEHKPGWYREDNTVQGGY